MSYLVFIDNFYQKCLSIPEKYLIKIKNFINFAFTLKKDYKTNQNQIDMGKGDKKTRRGKIILGTYGVRRPRKKTDKPEIKPVKQVMVKEPKEKKAC